MRIVLGCALIVSSIIAAGCAGTVRVTPAPAISATQRAAAQVRVSVYIDPEIERLRLRATTPSGDIGLGDLTVDFEVGSALAGTIRNAARQAFANVNEVATLACTDATPVLLAATMAAPPYIQIHWRDQTPRVGGGTIAEFAVRIARLSCGSDAPLQSAVARGAGRSEHMQSFANWPSDDDFQPGIDLALRDLEMNLEALFFDMAKALAAP